MEFSRFSENSEGTGGTPAGQEAFSANPEILNGGKKVQRKRVNYLFFPFFEGKKRKELLFFFLSFSIDSNALKFNVTDPPLKSKFDEIVDAGDQTKPPGWGKRTEKLLKDIIEDRGNSGYKHFDGSYHGPKDGVNGFDGVFVKGDLNDFDEIIINESKQFTSNIKLNGPSPTTDLPAQMTNEWVDYVADKLTASGKGDLANAIRDAKKNGKLTKIVTAVDRTGGQLTGGINVIKVN